MGQKVATGHLLAHVDPFSLDSPIPLGKTTTVIGQYSFFLSVFPISYQ
jgi:hypothetical protein